MPDTFQVAKYHTYRIQVYFPRRVGVFLATTPASILPCHQVCFKLRNNTSSSSGRNSPSPYAAIGDEEASRRSHKEKGPCWDWNPHMSCSERPTQLAVLTLKDGTVTDQSPFHG